jgi:Tfp pilus assembly protein PilX
MFLIAITLLTLSSMRATNIGLYMAQNEESRIAAEQAAQALADAIVANPSSHQRARRARGTDIPAAAARRRIEYRQIHQCGFPGHDDL